MNKYRRKQEGEFAHMGNAQFFTHYASFSNAQRKRETKAKLVEGMPGNYVANIRKVRGKSGTNIESNSPIVRELANRPYISDPEDLRMIQGRIDRTLRRAGPTDPEQGFITNKQDNQFFPTRQQAKQNFIDSDAYSLGGANMIYLPNEAQTRPGKALIQAHTHPAMDTSAVSAQDMMAASTMRNQRVMPGFKDRVLRSGVDPNAFDGYYDDWQKGTPMLEPGGYNDNFVMHHSAPGKVNTTYYSDDVRNMPEWKQGYHRGGKAAQNDMIDRVINSGLYPPEMSVDQKAMAAISELGSNTESVVPVIERQGQAVQRYYMSSPEIAETAMGVATGQNRGYSSEEIAANPGIRQRQKILENQLHNINETSTDYKSKRLGDMRIPSGTADALPSLEMVQPPTVSDIPNIPDVAPMDMPKKVTSPNIPASVTAPSTGIPSRPVAKPVGRVTNRLLPAVGLGLGLGGLAATAYARRKRNEEKQPI